MAQGLLKKSTATGPSRKPSNPGQKKGARVIKPKKQHLIRHNKVVHKHSAGLTAKTERALAERAGHLELLKGGKKDRKEAEAKKAAEALKK